MSQDAGPKHPPPKSGPLGLTEIDEEDMLGDDDLVMEQSRFKTWRKHIRDMYQTLLSYERTWTCHTMQFFPTLKEMDGGLAEQQVLCGTYTGAQEQNYVEISSIVLPTANQLSALSYDAEVKEVGGYGLAPNGISARVALRMYHDGDVSQARFMPSNFNLIATASSDGNVYIFDRTTIFMSKAPNKPERPLLPSAEEPNIDVDEKNHEKKLKQQEKLELFQQTMIVQEEWDKRRGPGQHKLALKYTDAPSISSETGSVVAASTLDDNNRATEKRKFTCIDWCSSTAGRLAAATQEGFVHVWSIALLPKVQQQQGGGQQGSIVPNVEASFNLKASAVTEIKFHPKDPFVIGAAVEGANTGLAFVDLRQKSETKLKSSTSVPNSPAGCIGFDWCPSNPFYIASGNSTGSVVLTDLRKPTSYISHVRSHASTAEVRPRWSPHASGIIATTGDDALSNIIDFGAKEGEEVLFKHSGHGRMVNDLAWSPFREYAGLVGSVDATHMMFWKPRDEYWHPISAEAQKVKDIRQAEEAERAAKALQEQLEKGIAARHEKNKKMFHENLSKEDQDEVEALLL